MKRSQINYVIDKAHAIAQTFRVCLPEFAYFTVDDWLQRERDNWQEVVDLQLGWDITDFGRSQGISGRCGSPCARISASVSAWGVAYYDGTLQAVEPPLKPAPAFFDRIELFVRDGDLLDEVIPFGGFPARCVHYRVEGVDALIVMASPADELVAQGAERLRVDDKHP